MTDHIVLRRLVAVLMALLVSSGCANSSPAPPSVATTATAMPLPTSIVPATTTFPAPVTTPLEAVTALATTRATASPAEPVALWEDATTATIGTTAQWTNKVELADINGDHLVDILFANGGLYDKPGPPEPSRVFVNQGDGKQFKEETDSVFGPNGMLARVIKVRDVTGDGDPDILVGTTYQTQSRLYRGDGQGKFTDETVTSLPQKAASIGDLEVGDVDGDGDLDVVLADWGPGNPMESSGGRTMLWLNDGTGHFSDVTDTQMPNVLVQFSWDLEFVDVNNDYDLDVLIACKVCSGSFLFENDGTGTFTDITQGKLPQFPNNYEFEAMDLNADAYLDLVTINDGEQRPRGLGEHVFLNDQHGGFSDATAVLWPASENLGYDDNVVAFLDYESDGDADFLIGSLDGPDRLLINDGTGHLKVATKVIAQKAAGNLTPGTLGLALADLNGDGALDMVQGQGEVAFRDAVFLGTNIERDSAPPMVTMVEEIARPTAGSSIPIRARVHDNQSSIKPYDLKSVVVRWTADGQTRELPLQWYGEYLWRGGIDGSAAESLTYQICATDVVGNEACSPVKP